MSQAELQALARTIVLSVIEYLDFQRNGQVDLPKGLTLKALADADLDYPEILYISAYLNQNVAQVIKNMGPRL